MAKLGISTGSAPNDGTGDSLLSGAIKINSNFNEIYSAIGDGTNITNRIAYATTAGFSTTSGYATTSGTSNYSTTSGFSTYSSLSGVATAANYANTSGISTVSQFAQNLTGTPNISVGVLTASSYYGNAGTLSGIITSIVAGTNVSVSLNGNVATISASGTGGGTSSQWLSVLSGIVTSSNVGIGTTIANSSLQVNNGTISLTGTPGSNVAISLRDNHRITFGDSGISDSSVFFDGSKLNIRTSGSVNISDTSGRDVFSAVAGEGAILYYDNSRKFQTLTDGAYVNGNLGVLGIVTASNLLVSGVSTFSGNVSFRDNNKILLGNDGDFEIYFDSSNTILQNSNTNSAGDLYIRSDSTLIQTFTGSETLAQFNSNGAVSLYHDNLKKFETIGTGVTVTGTTFTNQLSVSGIATIGPVATGTTSLYLGGPLKVGEIDISGGSNSVHVGQGAGRKNYNGGGGQQNTAVGWNALGVNQASNFNTAFGISALGALGDTQFNNYDENTAIGAYAGSSLLTGNANTFVGRSSGASITSGTRNTILGKYDGNQNGLDIRTSSNNVVLADGDGNIRFYANSSGNVGFGTTNPTSALTVNGSVTVNNGGVRLATNNPTIVGTSGTVGEIKRIGGAPFFYDGSAWREFVLSSGTPVSVPADTEWDNVVFRTTFDTDFTDAKFGATPVYVSAGSTIVGSPFKIGTGAFRNSGAAGAGVSYAYRSDYDFTGSWTIEFWMYHDSIPPSNVAVSLVSQISTSDGSGDWTLGLYSNGLNIWWYWDNENSPTNAVPVDLIAASTFNSQYVDKWVHYALVREGDNGSLHFYRDGVESLYTAADSVVDNDILHINGAGLAFGAPYGSVAINTINWNNGVSIDGIFDDVRISCGVGTAGQRYNSIGISTYATFTPPTTALPTTGTLSSYIQPPGDKYGEIVLGGSPTWRGTSGVTVTQQSSGNYRVSFASTYTNANDYFVLTQTMDQGFASYVGVARSTTHVDFAVNRESDNSAVDTGSLSVQIKNHI